jgi:hypothetical protein
MVATGSGLRNATESALSAESTASTVTVKVKMAFRRKVHECILPPADPPLAAPNTLLSFLFPCFLSPPTVRRPPRRKPVGLMVFVQN